MYARCIRFCVVIPMFNEETNAERCVRRVHDALSGTPHISAIIVVNDGSVDGTGDVLKALHGENLTLTVLTHERNEGYGRAIATGIGQAMADGYDYALFMDSDLTNDPKTIPQFVRHMEQGVDVIKASRYVEGGGMSGVPFHRRIISVVGNTIAHTLMGVPLMDCTNGFRAMKVSLLSQMRLTEPGFQVIMEELCYCKRLARTYAEVPCLLTSRGKAKGLSKFAYRPEVFWSYLKYVLKAAMIRKPVHLKSRS